MCSCVSVRIWVCERFIAAAGRSTTTDPRREGKLQNKKRKNRSTKDEQDATYNESFLTRAHLTHPTALFPHRRHCECSSNFGSAASFIIKLLWHSKLERNQSYMALERSEVELMKSFNWQTRQQRGGKVECSRWRWTAKSALEIDRKECVGESNYWDGDREVTRKVLYLLTFSLVGILVLLEKWKIKEK